MKLLTRQVLTAAYEGQSWGSQLTVRPRARSSAELSDCAFVIVSGEIHRYGSVTCRLSLFFLKVETEELWDSTVTSATLEDLKTRGHR